MTKQNEIAIAVKDVRKIYKLYDKPQDRVKEALGFGKKSHKVHYALNGVSMDIRRGETVGYGNYTVGLLSGERLVRVVYLLDSHGCRGSSEEAVKTLSKGIHEEQCLWLEERARRLKERLGELPPAFAAYPIQTGS